MCEKGNVPEFLVFYQNLLVYNIKERRVMLKIGKDNDITRNIWLKKKLNSIKGGLRILDAGAGELKNKPLCEHLIYTSQDFSQYSGKGDNRGLQTGEWDTSKVDIVSDICDIPCKSSSFDVILCSEVLEHVHNPIAAVRELDRLLVVGGKLIITAPFRSMTHFSPYHYCDGFNKYFYEKQLTNYDIIEITANGNFFDTFAEQLRLLPRIGRKYSIFSLSLVMYLWALPIYILLPILKMFDKGSNEISTYGYFVVAQKKYAI